MTRLEEETHYHIANLSKQITKLVKTQELANQLKQAELEMLKRQLQKAKISVSGINLTTEETHE